MDNFTHLAKLFKAAFPDITLSVRRCSMPRNKWADCREISKGSYLIRIAKDVDATAQEVLLIHEVAHALSWETDTHHTDHGPKFGIAYAKAWRTYLSFLESN